MYSPQSVQSASPNPAMTTPTTPTSADRKWVMDQGQDDELLSEFKKLEIKGLLKPEPLLQVRSLSTFHSALARRASTAR